MVNGMDEQQPIASEATCVTCHGPASGYKCMVCGEEAETHSSHCGAEANCQSKCSGCNEAESRCTC